MDQQTQTTSKPRMQMVGRDGNIFAIMGRAIRTLKQVGQANESSEMTRRVTASANYHEAVSIVQEYVEAY